MDTYERSYIIAKLIRMKKDEVEAREKAMEQIKNKDK